MLQIIGRLGRRGGTPPSRPTPAPRAPSVPGAAAPRESLRDILAPGGQPIGTIAPRTNPAVRTLRGGDEAARTMFERLTSGRGGVDVTPPAYGGRLVRLEDGSLIGYRPTSGSGLPTVDVNIPGLGSIKRLHFVD